MTKEEFYKKYDPDFLPLGFEKVEEPSFYYAKKLIPQAVIDENDLEEDEIPELLFGDTGLNKGFCIYTGEHFIFFAAENASQAVQWAEKILAFEPV